MIGPTIKLKEGALKSLPAPKPVATKHTEGFGYAEWYGRRASETMRFTNGRKLGHPRDMTDAEALAGIERAKRLAKRDMANLKKAGVDLGEAGNEALQATIEIMRKPGELRLKLAAARQVLEWTLAKPATKQDVTINQAEAWLDSLAEEDDGTDADEADDTSTPA